MAWLQRREWCLAVCMAGLACGPAPSVEPPSRSFLIESRTDDEISGTFVSGDRALEFSAWKVSPLVGDVELRVDALHYDLHYDYSVGEVITDGHGASLDRSTNLLLLAAIGAVTQYLPADHPDVPIHEQMLYASLVTWQEAGGMELDQTRFAMQPGDTDKSVGDDGVACVERGATYLTSFDYGSTTIFDRPITADERDCNGMCGPYCTQLTPFRMWTLDCLEHDACCRETDDNTCWTPLNACGDEYFEAETDFLRGFDPFQRHCGG